MISKTGEAETITTHYLFCLGLYRALYIFNWVWRYYFEGFFDLIAIVAGVVQTILYCDFFYLYVTKGGFCWYWDALSSCKHVLGRKIPIMRCCFPPLFLLHVFQEPLQTS